jgi:hypothetical protein
MTEAELGWTAGIIDGEGCIGLYHYGQPTEALSVAVGTCSKATAEKLQELWGGGLNIPRARTKGNRLQYRWAVRTKMAVQMLEEIEPHLVEKKDQAFVGLLFAETRVQRGKRIGPKVQVFRTELADKLKELKRG